MRLRLSDQSHLRHWKAYAKSVEWRGVEIGRVATAQPFNESCARYVELAAPRIDDDGLTLFDVHELVLIQHALPSVFKRRRREIVA